MSKRVPVDIQFLMESILSESPDRFSIDSQDAEKFKKLGINQKVGTVYWYDEEAYPFFIEPKDKIVIYRRGDTHGGMEALLMYASQKAGNEASFSLSYEPTDMNGDIGFVSEMANNKKCYFHGLKGNDLNAVREYLLKHAEYFKNLEIRGAGNGVEANEIAGRLWKERNVISFWNDKDEVMPYMKEIFSFMKNLGVDIHTALYEFLDSRGFYTHYELTGQLPDTKEKLSAAEKQEMLAQKHLKKDREEFGSQFWAQHGKKAAKGFDIPAKASAAMPAREGIIKLKDLIKESPDSITSVNGRERLAYYGDADAVAFFAYPKFSALNVGGIHSDIMREFQSVYENLEQIKNDPQERKFYANEIRRHGINLSSFDDLFDSLLSGLLHDFFSSVKTTDDNPDDTGIESGGFRVMTGGLAGRLWKDKKLISFWNEKKEVFEKWDYVEKMFNDYSPDLGNLDDYKIDWIERDVRGGGELTPASSLSSNRTTKKNDPSQLNFLDKLAGEEPISQEEIRKIQQRLHTMKPKEKKAALMKLGALNTKASDIADKLGMTVAEFNHIMNVNESNSAD